MFARSRLLFAVLFLAGALTGCNAFDFQNADAPRDVPTLLANARAAVNAGDYEGAVAALETAHEIEPENVEVRVELANALYLEAGLDILTMKEVSDFLSGVDLSGVPSSSTLGAAKFGSGLECTNGKDPRVNGYRLISLSDERSVIAFLDQEGVIDRVAKLLLLDPENNAQFQALGIKVQARGLLVAAFNRVATMIVELWHAAREFNASIYRDENYDVVFCAPTELELDETEETACASAARLNRARRLLILRNRIFSPENDNSELIEALTRVVTAVEENINCPRLR